MFRGSDRNCEVKVIHVNKNNPSDEIGDEDQEQEAHPVLRQDSCHEGSSFETVMLL